MSTIEAQRPETIQITIPVLAAEQQARQSEALDPQTVSTLKESLFDEVKFALSQSKDTSYTMPDYQQALIAQIRHELAAADGKEFTDDQILAVINAKLTSANKQERRTWEEIGDRVIKQQIADLQAYAQAEIDFKPAPQEKFESRKAKIAQTANTGQKVEQKIKTSGPWYKFGRGKGTAYGEVQINFGKKNDGIFGKNYTNIAQFNESTRLNGKTDRARRVRDRYGLANDEIIPPQKKKMMEQVLIKQVTALQDVSVRRHGGSISDENGFSFVQSQIPTEYQTIGTSRPKVNLQIEGLKGGEAFSVDFSDKPEEQLKRLTEFLNKITLEKVAEIESGKHQKAKIDTALIIAKNEANEELGTRKPNQYDDNVAKFIAWELHDWESKSFDKIKNQIQGNDKWDASKEQENKKYFLEMQEYAKKIQKKQAASYRVERISQAIATLYPKNSQDTEKLLGRASLGVISEKVHPANIKFEEFRKANPKFPPAYLHIAYVLMGEGVFEPTSEGRALMQKVNKIITPQELFAFLDDASANDKSIYNLNTSETTHLLKKITPEKIKEIFAYIKTRAEQGFNGSEAEELAGLELKLDKEGGFEKIANNQGINFTKTLTEKDNKIQELDNLIASKDFITILNGSFNYDKKPFDKDKVNSFVGEFINKMQEYGIDSISKLSVGRELMKTHVKKQISSNAGETKDDYDKRVEEIVFKIGFLISENEILEKVQQPFEDILNGSFNYDKKPFDKDKVNSFVGEFINKMQEYGIDSISKLSVGRELMKTHVKKQISSNAGETKDDYDKRVEELVFKIGFFNFERNNQEKPAILKEVIKHLIENKIFSKEKFEKNVASVTSEIERKLKKNNTESLDYYNVRLKAYCKSFGSIIFKNFDSNKNSFLSISNQIRDLTNREIQLQLPDHFIESYDQALLHLQPGTQMVQEIMQATGLPLEKACQVVYGIAEKRKKTIEQTQ